MHYHSLHGQGPIFIDYWIINIGLLGHPNHVLLTFISFIGYNNYQSIDHPAYLGHSLVGT